MSDEIKALLSDAAFIAFDDGRNNYSLAASAKDRIEELEAANARLRQSQAWQPIETAPSDGTPFLALWPHPDHDEKSSEIRTWYWEERWLNPYESSLYTPPPTHWMPLPEAPKETDK